MTINEFAQFSYARSTTVLHMMTDDLTAGEWLHRPVAGANCCAWIIGHLIVVERNVLKLTGCDLPPLPYEDFVARHNKGATPSDADDYGDVLKLMPLWDAQRNALVERLKTLDAADFDRPMNHPVFNNVGQFIALIPNHTMLHAGQISTIRRSLGRPAAM